MLNLPPLFGAAQALRPGVQTERNSTHTEGVGVFYFILLYKVRVTKGLTQHVLSKQQKIETTERAQKN